MLGQAAISHSSSRCAVHLLHDRDRTLVHHTIVVLIPKYNLPHEAYV